MSDVSAKERLARAALTCVAEPGDPVMGALLRTCAPAEIVAALVQGRVPVPATGPAGAAGSDPDRPPEQDRDRPLGWDSGSVHGLDWDGLPGLDRARLPGLDRDSRLALERALRRWAGRLGEAPAEADLDAWRRAGIRLVCPGDAEWPGQLEVLGDARPWGLWVRGSGDLRYACLRSASVVGTRSATAYGSHVCTEMAATLAERGWTVVSGGAFGIDGCAHRGVIGAGGVTVAVFACGVDCDYPPGHHGLFREIRARGVTVSEWPPGRMPTRPGFLVRNRVIAALSRGTVVVEAAQRSGALNTARHARDQGRPLMAVPGPVTSTLSEGCHDIIRDWGAICVTGARDVMEVLSFSGDEPPGRARGPVLPRDALDPVTRQVLEAVPARAGRGPARIAVVAGVG
ncbi:MAG TPA: DNA-processing protein DprA, partial [Streptosporangiaceae bacterium]|nr:DNA-processing protein DprA [Streptosporangiaceae bacterium]